jgi:hypothetical protein
VHGGGQCHDAAGDRCHVRKFGRGKRVILASASTGFAEGLPVHKG